MSNLALPDQTVEQHAAEIRRLAARSSQDIVEIGLRLSDVKKQLKERRDRQEPTEFFGEWLDREFGWSDETARRFMRVAVAFPEIGQADRFSSEALYALASGDVPQEVRKEFIEREQAGEKITLKQVRERIKELTPERPEPEPAPTKIPFSVFSDTFAVVDGTPVEVEVEAEEVAPSKGGWQEALPPDWEERSSAVNSVLGMMKALTFTPEELAVVASFEPQAAAYLTVGGEVRAWLSKFDKALRKELRKE